MLACNICLPAHYLSPLLSSLLPHTLPLCSLLYSPSLTPAFAAAFSPVTGRHAFLLSCARLHLLSHCLPMPAYLLLACCLPPAPFLPPLPHTTTTPSTPSLPPSQVLHTHTHAFLPAFWQNKRQAPCQHPSSLHPDLYNRLNDTSFALQHDAFLPAGYHPPALILLNYFLPPRACTMLFAHQTSLSLLTACMAGAYFLCLQTPPLATPPLCMDRSHLLLFTAAGFSILLPLMPASFYSSSTTWLPSQLGFTHSLSTAHAMPQIT